MILEKEYQRRRRAINSAIASVEADEGPMDLEQKKALKAKLEPWALGEIAAKELTENIVKEFLVEKEKEKPDAHRVVKVRGVK